MSKMSESSAIYKIFEHFINCDFWCKWKSVQYRNIIVAILFYSIEKNIKQQ
jgi:hypothetical protein